MQSCRHLSLTTNGVNRVKLCATLKRCDMSIRNHYLMALMFHIRIGDPFLQFQGCGSQGEIFVSS